MFKTYHREVADGGLPVYQCAKWNPKMRPIGLTGHSLLASRDANAFLTLRHLKLQAGTLGLYNLCHTRNCMFLHSWPNHVLWSPLKLYSSNMHILFPTNGTDIKTVSRLSNHVRRGSSPNSACDSTGAPSSDLLYLAMFW
jgi:hypothetical protein